MITWKTHSNIIIARNPQNGIYVIDLLTLDERMVGVICVKSLEEQKQLFHELNTNRVQLKNYHILYLGSVGAWN